MILAAHQWRNNSALIDDARALGYIGSRVLDPTYGRGNWWKKWQPDELVKHDLKLDGVDFRDLPDEGLFDTVAFDPPYIPQGGRDTSTLGAPCHHDDFKRTKSNFLDSYGLRHGPKTTAELRTLVNDGMTSFTAVLRQRGTLLVKCMSYVNGGAWRAMPRWIANDAEALGYVQIDEFVHLRTPGPQPIRDFQRTARRNYSMLMVFRWPNLPASHAERLPFNDERAS